MTENETTSGGAVWRKRAIASVSVAAAVCAAGVAFASSANAAAATIPLTATVTAPTTVVNDGSSAASQLLKLEVKNPDPAATANGTATLNVTKPAGLACTNIAVTTVSAAPAGTAPTFAPLTGATNGTTCTVADTTFGQAGNSDDTYTYSVAVTGTGITGTLGFQATLTQSVDLGNGNNSTSTTTTNTANSSLVAPAANTAPTFSATAPPVPVVFQKYNAKIVTSAGIPTATYSAFGAPIKADPTTNRFTAGTTRTATTSVTNPTTGASDAAIYLDNGFYFDTVTGVITDQGSASGSVIPPSENTYKWTIIANNGQGGATAATPGTIAGVAQPTPDVALHDVDSQPFLSVRVFKDVPLTSLFSDPIYDLVDNDVILGNADGTFRPTTTVTRAEFVTFIARDEYTTGPFNGQCNALFDPSAFSDVPNSSPFCYAVQTLASLGIVKGTTATTFSPNATVNRQSVAAFLYRTNAQLVGAAVTDAQPTTTQFTDVPASNPFSGDIDWAATNGITTGVTATTFKPAGTALRQEAAAFIFRFNDL